MAAYELHRVSAVRYIVRYIYVARYLQITNKSNPSIGYMMKGCILEAVRVAWNIETPPMSTRLVCVRPDVASDCSDVVFVVDRVAVWIVVTAAVTEVGKHRPVVVIVAEGRSRLRRRMRVLDVGSATSPRFILVVRPRSRRRPPAVMIAVDVPRGWSCMSRRTGLQVALVANADDVGFA